MLAEIGELDSHWERFAQQIGGRLRADHLPAMGDRHQAGGAVEDRAVVVAVTQLGGARMYPDPNPQGAGLGPAHGFQCTLYGERGNRSIGRHAERCVEAVAGRLHHLAAMVLDRVAQDRVVGGECALHPLRELFPEPGRSLDIGEQEGDCPRG